MSDCLYIHNVNEIIVREKEPRDSCEEPLHWYEISLVCEKAIFNIVAFKRDGSLPKLTIEEKEEVIE